MAVAEVSQLAASLDRVRALDPQQCSAAELVSALEEMELTKRRLEAEQTRWLAVAIERDATVEECGKSARSWWIEDHHIAPADAALRAKLAVELPAYPRLRKPFDSGAITMDHASVILTALLDAPVEYREAMEAELVEGAREVPPFLLARRVNELRERLGIERTSEQRRMRQDAQRHVNLAQTFGGSWHSTSHLSPLCGEEFELALANAPAGKCTGPEDKRTAAQRRHDAFQQIIEHYLATASLPIADGERPRVCVTMGFDSLKDDLSNQWGVLDSGVEISPATARRLACDCELIPAVLGARGEVLDIGRATRIWTAPVRRAIKIRDGDGCVFPGCLNSRADTHHMVEWSKGGETSVDNGCFLCALHHWLVHEGGWTVRRAANGHYTWSSPRGVVRSGPPPRHRQAA